MFNLIKHVRFTLGKSTVKRYLLCSINLVVSELFVVVNVAEDCDEFESFEIANEVISNKKNKYTSNYKQLVLTNSEKYK